MQSQEWRVFASLGSFYIVSFHALATCARQPNLASVQELSAQKLVLPWTSSGTRSVQRLRSDANPIQRSFSANTVLLHQRINNIVQKLPSVTVERVILFAAFDGLSRSIFGGICAHLLTRRVYRNEGIARRLYVVSDAHNRYQSATIHQKLNLALQSGHMAPHYGLAVQAVP